MYLSCRNVFFKKLIEIVRVFISSCVYLSNFSLVVWGFLLFVGFVSSVVFCWFGAFCFVLKNSCSLNLMDIKQH